MRRSPLSKAPASSGNYNVNKVEDATRRSKQRASFARQEGEESGFAL
eukprot:CAMPEP_0206439928 /NCGR_PEP_ID=MMETSP0324_2-20121206/12482_1 /ASSEMBLY_ACC=CAM_ASM_000836 /TAXON_ID=2866 /ORGANISM="Crypthecodinium cohnii, Strain Seligo" /LENGTH=46 /DNA_ID= /DNA_START= /DNA_END= /DNA_ORIENTATION=